MRHRSSRARHSTSGARHRSSGGRHRSAAPRVRLPRPALPLGEHLGRPVVVCSLAVVALGVSSVLTQGAPSASVSATGASPLSLVSLLQDSSGGALAASPAGSVGSAGQGRPAGGSALDPAAAPPRTHRGELPVNTLVAPAQPATVLEGGRFGWRIAPDLGKREFHNGTDLSAPAGTPVVAAAQGRVTAVFWDVWGGNRVEVAHADGLRTTYSHLEDVRVEVGDDLAAAQRLGSVGATGVRVTGPHLHFETWVDGAAADPQSFDWLTDAGIVPGTATPYSLAEDAPSPAEVSELLRRSTSGGDKVQVMASSPAKVTVTERSSSAPERAKDTAKNPAKDTAKNTAKEAAKESGTDTGKSTVQEPERSTGKDARKDATADAEGGGEASKSAPTTQETSTGSERDPSPTRSAPTAPEHTAPEPTAEPTTRPEPVRTQPVQQPAPEPSVSPAPTAEPTAPAETPEEVSEELTSEEKAAEKAAEKASEEAAKRAEELRRDQQTHASPTADTDGDGVADSLDDDLDGDGIRNALDTDLDGDGVLNADEAAPEDVWSPGAPGSASTSTAAPAAGTTGTPATAS